MKIIKQGAEAVLYLSTFDHQKVLVKERIKKKYRIEPIDEKLRKERTRKEVRLMTESRKFGVLTPSILRVEEKAAKIFMEFVDGPVLKDYLNSVGENEVRETGISIGTLVGKLHANGLIHGDLTTSNMILKDKKIFLIDFGLGDYSRRIEDQGVDINLLQEAVRSTHYQIFDLVWNNILKGYKQEYTNADKVLRKVEEIERRARYVERE